MRHFISAFDGDQDEDFWAHIGSPEFEAQEHTPSEAGSRRSVFSRKMDTIMEINMPRVGGGLKSGIFWMKPYILLSLSKIYRERGQRWILIWLILRVR
jgi:hypothetical protein